MSVGFVYDHRDRTHGFQQSQDPFQISFRYPLPHTAKILQGHRRNPNFAGKAGGDESFPRTHRPADYVAHGQDIGVAGVDGFGGILQLALGLVISGDKRQIKSALHKLQQTAGLGFNQVLLTVGEKLQRERLPILHRMGDQALQLNSFQARAQLGQGFIVHFGAGGQFLIFQLRADKLQPIGIVGQRNPNRRNAWVLNDARVQLDLILRDETNGDIGIQKSRIARPAFENDQGIAIIRGHAGNIAGGSDGLGEINHQPDLLAVGNAQPEIVVEQVQYRVRIARQTAFRIGGAVKTVVAFERAAEVGLTVGGSEVQPATVVMQN